MGIQLVVKNNESCSAIYHEPVDDTRKTEITISKNIVSMAKIKENRSYEEAKKRATAVAEALDW